VRVVEIATYVIASAVALGGGFVGADMLFGERESAVSESAAARTATPETAGVEVRNARFGFRFRHPQSWGAGPRNHPSIIESVAGGGGAFCYVTVQEHQIPSDGSGKPRNLARLMDGMTARQLANAAFPGVSTKVESFGAATLGGQDARAFVIGASVPLAGTLRMQGWATLRNFGALVLLCVAPSGQSPRDEVRDAFRQIHASFRFE
jgi:hypothetical protein